MPNALSRFIVGRQLTVERLQRKKILITIHNKPVELHYLRSLVKKEDAHLSFDYIDQLDKEFQLTPEERADLETMVQRKKKKIA